MPIAQLPQARPSFLDRLPLASAAFEFARERHAGQVRGGDGAPFVLHPLEVGCLLVAAGYPDHVVSAGVLHDILEDTATEEYELAERFGAGVARLVRIVSDDPSIEDEQARKEALRSQVAAGPAEAGAVFAADKVSKSRELRLRLTCGLRADVLEAGKLRHYCESLSMLEPKLGRSHPILHQLRFELEALDMLPPAWAVLPPEIKDGCHEPSGDELERTDCRVPG